MQVWENPKEISTPQSTSDKAASVQTTSIQTANTKCKNVQTLWTCFCYNRKGSQCVSKIGAEIADSLQGLNSSNGDLYSDTVYLNTVNRANEESENFHCTQ